MSARLISLFLILCHCGYSNAQKAFEAKRTITSTLTKIIAGTGTSEAKVDTTVTSDGQTIITTVGGRDTGDDIFLAKREVKIIPKKEQTVLEFNIKRIKQKNNFLDVDTDSPFSDNIRSKNVTEHYQKYLDNKKQLILQDGKIIERFEGNLGPWDSLFPKLYPLDELSGFLVEMPDNSLTKWTDSLYSDRYLYITTYEIIRQEGNNIELTLSGYSKPLKSLDTIKSPTVNINELREGSGIQMDVKILRMEYQGNVTVDNDTGIIQKGEITVDKDYLMVGGLSQSKFPKTTLSFYTIENEVR